MLLKIPCQIRAFKPLEKKNNKITHKPSLKAVFFLSACANRQALHHSRGRDKGELCQHAAVRGQEAAQKWGLPSEEGQALLTHAKTIRRGAEHK